MKSSQSPSQRERVSPSQRERVEAHIALALPAPPPIGEPPTLEEIEAWRLHRLTEPRAAEVMSYVARDPMYYQQWFELRQAAAELAAEASQSKVAAWKSRLSSLTRRFSEPLTTPVLLRGGLATAFVLVVAVTLLLPRQETPEWARLLDEDQTRWGSLAGLPTTAWPWRGIVTKGEIGPGPTPEQQSFQVGAREALASLYGTTAEGPAILQGLAREPGRCAATDDGCPQRQQAIQALGHWAALAHLACTQGRTDSAQLGQRLAQWSELKMIRQAEPWRTVLGDRPYPEAAAPPCQQVRELLAHALPVR
ncbi:conserved hypothetical protein [Gammaproteobacteria bacterium]